MNKTLIILFLALIIGGFTRSYELLDRYYYGHDADLAAWTVKDMALDGHPRLIGQLTSSPGIFIGPLFYYLLVPLYFISGFQPPATLFYSLFIGLFAIFSLYYVTAKIWGRTTAFVAALLYASSFSIAATEREVVPTTPVFLWTIWAIYAIHLIRRGSLGGLYLLALLAAAVWHIHLALGLIILLAAGLSLLSRRFPVRSYFGPAALFTSLSAPLAAFEIKHNFIQARSLIGTFGASTEQVARTLMEKTHHVAAIALKIINLAFWDRPESVRPEILPALIVIGFLLVALQLSRVRFWAGVFAVWFFLLLGFFIRHPINISEYYLNSLLVPALVMLAVVLARHKIVGTIIVIFVIGLNFWRLGSSTANASGFVARSTLVDFIDADAAAHGYPCVAVSYMTDPGNDLGYRFLFFRKNLHVNRPDSGSPVYTIVYPHGRANHLDFTFGALGLVLPEYSRYTKPAVDHSCSGADSNLTDPMFGFTN